TGKTGFVQFKNLDNTKDYLILIPDGFYGSVNANGGKNIVVKGIPVAFHRDTDGTLRTKGMARVKHQCDNNADGLNATQNAFLKFRNQVGEFYSIENLSIRSDHCYADTFVTSRTSGPQHDSYFFNNAVSTGDGKPDGLHADTYQDQSPPGFLRHAYVENTINSSWYSGYTTYHAKKFFVRNSEFMNNIKMNLPIIPGLSQSVRPGKYWGYPIFMTADEFLNTGNTGVRVDENVFTRMDGMMGVWTPGTNGHYAAHGLTVPSAANADGGAVIDPYAYGTVMRTNAPENYSCTTAIDEIAACGSAHGAMTAETPSENLCRFGDPMKVTRKTAPDGKNYYLWDCQSFGSHVRTASCIAPVFQPVDGTCGSAHNQLHDALPTANLCKTGTVSNITGTGPWNWDCLGESGGKNAECHAAINPSALQPSLNFTATPSSVLYGGQSILAWRLEGPSIPTTMPRFSSNICQLKATSGNGKVQKMTVPIQGQISTGRLRTSTKYDLVCKIKLGFKSITVSKSTTVAVSIPSFSSQRKPAGPSGVISR
ncbi:MAG TPA: hypothetical protein DIS76_07520, partial [Rhodospirillaceae bacterium]|nr:hypothetical protein [Rhodospirillaceae bacterium]